MPRAPVVPELGDWPLALAPSCQLLIQLCESALSSAGAAEWAHAASELSRALLESADVLPAGGTACQLRRSVVLAARSALHLAQGCAAAAAEDGGSAVALCEACAAPASGGNGEAAPLVASPGVALLLPRALQRWGVALISAGVGAAGRAALQRALALAADASRLLDSGGAEVASAAACGYLFQHGVDEELFAAAAAAALAERCRVALLELERSASFEGGGGGGDPAPVDADFAGMEAWLLSTAPGEAAPSSAFPYLCIRSYGEGSRGVHARCDLPAEVEVMAVGERFLLTVEVAREHEVCRAIAAAGVERDLSAAKHCYLSVFVLCTRGNPHGPFAPYYAVLPRAFPGMPLFWAPEELAWLAGSHVLEQVEERRRNVCADWKLLCDAVPSLGEAFTLDDFLWARMMVASRNFGISVDGVRTDALVPYADMLNHLRPRQTRWLFDSQRRAFRIISMVPIVAGQQVFDSYGRKCNSRFLLNYGFAVEHNVDEDTGQCHNEVRFVLHLPPQGEDQWHWHKLRVSTFYEAESTLEAFSFLRFAHASGAWHGFVAPPPPPALHAGAGGPPPPEPLLRVDVRSELAQCPGPAPEAEAVDAGTRPIPPLSCANEAVVLGVLARHAREMLSRYPRPLAEDLTELASGASAPFSNRRNALLLVSGEKAVCQFYVDLQARAAPLLRATDARAALEEAEALCEGASGAGAAAHAAEGPPPPPLCRDAARYYHAVVVPLLRRRAAAAAV